MELSFLVPASNTRVFLLDHPEIKAIALLTVSTKLCFPFQEDQQPVIDAQRSFMPCFDWSKWNPIGETDHIEREKEMERQQTLAKLTPNEVVNLNDEDFDAFLAHVTRSIDIKGEFERQSTPHSMLTPTSGESSVAQFFPEKPEPDASPRMADKPEEQLDEEAQRGLYQATRVYNTDSKVHQSFASATLQYEAFRNPKELPSTVRAFYKAAGMFKIPQIAKRAKVY